MNGIGQGADGEFEALALIRMLCCTFKSSLRYIVIKSKCLLHHASVCTHAGDFLQTESRGGRVKFDSTVAGHETTLLS